MKVVYEKTILDMITAAARQAEMLDKRVEYIELTKDEAKRFTAEMNRMSYCLPDWPLRDDWKTARCMGIEIRREAA